MRILFLPGAFTSPSANFRVHQFVKPLIELGHDVDSIVIQPDRLWSSKIKYRIIYEIHNKLGALIRFINAIRIIPMLKKYDIIFMNRDIIPAVHIDFIEPLFSKVNPNFIFDFDDTIYLGARGEKVKKILPYFAKVFAGNENLAEFAREYNHNVIVFPTVVDSKFYQPVSERKPGKLRIGWSGSHYTIIQALPLLQETLEELSNKIDFEFIIIANKDPNIRWKGVNSTYIPWGKLSEVENLQLMDIGLMPLRDEPPERGKCGLKAIQYMGIGIPTIVSPVGVNKEIVIHGVTGFHANNKKEWLNFLEILASDSELRKIMGNKGRKRMVDHYSIDHVLPIMLNEFNKLLS